jgi:CRP-like cAMP-binding protein
MMKKTHVLPGERTNPEGKPLGNKILMALPDAEYRVIRPHLEYQTLPDHRSLYEPNEKCRYSYFPNSGMISLVVTTERGQTVEVGVIGNEGLAGNPCVIGMRSSPLREVVQISGDGFRVEAETMASILKATPHLQKLLHRFVVLQQLQVAQTAACNRLHKVHQRLARWLLMTQDRVDNGALPITHDFLATMLGTDRPSVSIAAAKLRKKGLIRYSRGGVRILNRNKLERQACECYGVIQQLNGSLGIR